MPDISSKSSKPLEEKNNGRRALGTPRRSLKKSEPEPSQESGVGINLIDFGTQKTKASASERSLKHVLEAFFLALLIVLIAYGGLYGYRFMIEGELSSARQQLDMTNTAIAKLEVRRGEITRFEDALGQLKKLLANRTYWSGFFGELEKNTIPEVTYVSMVSDASGNVSLTGIAKDYTAIGRELRLMEDAKNFAKNPTVSGASSVLSPTGEVIGVNFSLTFQINQDILKRQ